MANISRYWRLVQLDSTGRCFGRELETAKVFFQTHCAEWIEQSDGADAPIQRRLLQLWRAELNTTTQEQQDGAELCLRCVVSDQIQRACLWLAQKYGSQHGFTAQELFPLVLDDQEWRGARKRAGGIPERTYLSLAQQILQSYDPQQAALSTWVRRQVLRHPEVNAFLKQHGIHLISDWGILNGMKSGRLARILADFYRLTPAEIQQADALLQSYQAIYIAEYQHQRLAGMVKKGRTCPDPTLEQLTRMAAHFQTGTGLQRSPEQILQHLKALALRLRQYRIDSQGGYGQLKSLDALEFTGLTEKLQAPDRDLDSEAQIDFLKTYHQEFEDCLQQSLEQVTTDRLAYLKASPLKVI